MTRLPALLAVPLALALASCQSFDQLRRDDPAVSEHEVHAAGDASDEDLLEHLHHILDTADEYPVEVVVAALVAVGERARPESLPHVLPLCDAEDEEVRWHVAETLAALGGDRARQALDDMAEREPSDLVLARIEELCRADHP